MAEVFEAELVGEQGFSRKVALKRMSGDAAVNPGAAARFLDEARIASRLHHAHVVSVLDVGLLDDRPFQVLELVDGLDVQALLQRAGDTLPIEIALIIAGAVAHALDHAHTMCDASGAPLGIVHRDVKPSNVLVSWGGDVKLTDFGIAVARDRVARTEAGAIAGTMGFIAPEQRMGSHVDGRADVFALGLTLHAMLAGYTPLRDASVELATMVGQRVPLAAGLPDDLAAILADALSPERMARPTAAQLAHALGEAVAARLTGDARGTLQRFVAPLGRKPRTVGALDQLLGIEVVAADAGGDDRVPRYQTVAVARAAEATPALRPVREEEAAGAPEVLAAGAPEVLAAGAPEVLAAGAPEVLAAGAPEVPAATSMVRRARRGGPFALVVVAAIALGGLTWRVAALRDAPSDDRLPPARVAMNEPGVVARAAQGVVALDEAVGARVSGATPGDAGVVASVPSNAAGPDAAHVVASVPSNAAASDAAHVVASVLSTATAPGAAHVVANVPSDAAHVVANVPSKASFPGAIAQRTHAPGTPAPPRHAHPDAGTARHAAAEPAIGYLQVLGVERGKVMVDGGACDGCIGYVPNPIAVPLGAHTVRVEAPDGSVAGTFAIEVTSFHTLSHPARRRL
jgi:hypothetical protein